MGEHREHRADIRRPDDGLVIELQHSYIKQDEVKQREAFYGHMWWVFDTEPWWKRSRVHRDPSARTAVSPVRFRVRLAADGTAQYRWISRSRTLDAAKRPIFLDLGGPLLHVTGFGGQGCVSGSGVLLSRAEFIARAGLRQLSDEELSKTSHYTLQDGTLLLARSLDALGAWPPSDRTATHHDLAGRQTLVPIHEVPLVEHGHGDDVLLKLRS